MNDMKRFRLPLASVLLAVWMASVGAMEGLAPMPVAVAESEAFEAVGRLSDEGLVWFIDRADSNVPVLAPTCRAGMRHSTRTTNTSMSSS